MPPSQPDASSAETSEVGSRNTIGREQVEEDAGEAVDGHGRRRPQAGDRARRHHRQRDPGDVGGCGPAPGSRAAACGTGWSAGTSMALIGASSSDRVSATIVAPPLVGALSACRPRRGRRCLTRSG